MVAPGIHGRPGEAGAGASSGARVQILSASNGPSGVFYDEDYMANGQGNLELLRYTFQASDSNQSIRLTPVVGSTTFHFYGFGAEQVFNNPWAGSTDWTTSSWGSAVPNYQGPTAMPPTRASAAA